MTRDEIKKDILDKNKEWLVSIKWGEFSFTEQADTLLDIYCHTLGGSVVGSVTSPQKTSKEQLEKMKAEIHFDLFMHAKKLIAMLAHREGEMN